MSTEVHLWKPGPPEHPPIDWPSGWRVEYIAETGSTNTDLLNRLADRSPASPSPVRTVLVTGHQTAGRGRRDRRWDAPPDTNLLASMLFTVVPHDPSELMRRTGLAVDAAARSFGHETALKWPNDVVVGDAKVAGLLAQRASSGEVIVGFGINLGWAPAGAARLAGVDRAVLLAAILQEFDRLPADIEERYRERLATLGRDVRVEMQDRELVGRAVDVDSDGRLMIESTDGRIAIGVGDVVHLRPR